MTTQTVPAVQPTHPGLPDLCYVDITKLGLDKVNVAIILRGVHGYHPVAVDEVRGTAAVYVDIKNASLGVVPPQREAMLCGALFGWHTPGADPARFNADGTYIGRVSGKTLGPPSIGDSMVVRRRAWRTKVIK